LFSSGTEQDGSWSGGGAPNGKGHYGILNRSYGAIKKVLILSTFFKSK